MASADSTVVFNEIMYHPSPDLATMEWIELHNQMAVDMDLSGWSIAGGVQFKFPPGTIIVGGGHLVVAASPATLTAATGLTNLVGPLLGRLANEGEILELHDNSQRLMDSVHYRDTDEWPVAADGAGPSLAKRHPDLASPSPESWTWSTVVGGTPGAENFPSGATVLKKTEVVSLTGEWRYEDSGEAPSFTWSAASYDDALWNIGHGLFYVGESALPATKGTPLTPGRTTYYFRRSFDYTGGSEALQLSLRSVVEGGAAVYLNGVEVSRWNLPAGALTASTRALASSSAVELRGPFVLPADHLVTGRNVLAVEVHAGPLSQGNTGFSLSPAAGFSLVWDGNDGDFYDPATGAAAPDNLALASNGTLAFGSSEYGAGIHLISHVNDGFYGNSHSWLANFPFGDANPYVGVRFTGVVAIASIAWGRDNGDTPGDCCGGQLSDRWEGTYTWQFTRMSAPGTGTAETGNPATGWANLGVVRYLGARTGFNPWLRHRFEVTENGGPILMTGLRVEVSDPNLCIDELEAFSKSASVAGDIAFGLNLEILETLPLALAVAFNEVASDGEGFWVELVNYGAQPVPLAGFVLAVSGHGGGGFVLPEQTLAAGAFLVLTQAQLGFGAGAGDKLFLYPPGRQTVLDAVAVRSASEARLPQATGRWLSPDLVTPGASNSFSLHHEIVINEILYHPRPLPATMPPAEPLPFRESSGAFIELYNRGTNAVDLTSWRLSGGVDFAFPPSTLLQPDHYLVVAQDAAFLRPLHPDVEVVGDFAGRLSHKGDLVRLRDANDNPADEVRFLDGGRWPEYADGGGSSLELRDPRADSSNAGAWSASDETGKAAWRTYRYRGVAQQEYPNERWNEFVLGLFGEGEVLLDDISVIESPAGAAVEKLQNGSFELGAASWRMLGNHGTSKVEPDPENPAKKVLHLISTGQTEDRHNHVETTFRNNSPVVNGREYEISFRARWLAGANQLNTRLYFNRLARRTELETPQESGTPGARNSRFEANIGPTYSDLRHRPVLPAAGEPVTVEVSADDPDGVASATLWWSVNSGAWASVPMTVTGHSSTRKSFAGQVPGQGSGAVVQFYVQGEDQRGLVSTTPAQGRDSRALMMVQDNQAAPGRKHNLRIIMTRGDIERLHSLTNVMSNAYLGATVVYDETEVFYEAGVRLKGSMAARPASVYLGFNVTFPPEHLFRGVHETISLDRSGRGALVANGQEEILIQHMINHAGGLPAMYDDLAYLIAPRASENGPALLQMAEYGEVFLESRPGDGGQGTVFNYDLIYQPNQTVGDPVQGIKVPEGYIHPSYNVDMENLGADKETYRWHFRLMNHHDEDDYSRLIEFLQAMSLSETALDSATRRLMEVDEWMRLFAMLSLSGVGSDTYGRGLNHNLRLYVPPGDGKVMALPWDMDNSAFGLPANASLWGGGNLTKVITLPANQRRYYGHLLDLIDTTFNTRYMGYWTAHYSSLLPGQNFSGALSYIANRTSYVMSQLPPRVPFAVTSNGGRGFMTNTPSVVIAGGAWIDLRDIVVQGRTNPPELTWTSPTSWRLSVPLMLGANELEFLAYDFPGHLASSNRITVTTTALGGGLDSDGDGMPDVWEWANGLNPAVNDAALDPDDDGFSNYQEYLAGTNPRDPQSMLRLDAAQAGGQLRLSLQAVAGRTYSLLVRDAIDEGKWSLLRNVTAEAGDHRVTVTVSAEASQRLFRLVTPQSR